MITDRIEIAPEEDLLDGYPRLTREEIRAAISSLASYSAAGGFLAARLGRGRTA
jgi:uncharacterized protein (DUF433 family)